MKLSLQSEMLMEADSLVVEPEGMTPVPLIHPADIGNEEQAGPGLSQLALRAVGAYWELTKPRVTSLILPVAAAGFWLASEGSLDGRRLAVTLLGISLLAGGIFALNQYLERDLDALMRRTENRPLPTGRLNPAQVLWFGLGLTLPGLACLTFLVNPLSGALGLVTMVSYLFMYTPLKRRTRHCTLIGAFPGAMPPLLGWAAARGELGFEGWVLFSILFLWQFPHFLSIGWLYREDYARAGIRMLPVLEPKGRGTARQIMLTTVTLVPVSLIPTFSGLSGTMYLAGALALGLAFLSVSVGLARLRTKPQARRVLLASVVYLPLLFGLMVVAKT